MNTEAHARLGVILRSLHETLAELGNADPVRRVAQELPEAQSRLTYVGELAERAAQKVLDAVDLGKPQCQAIAQEGRELTHSVQGGAETNGTLVAYANKCVEHAERQDQLLTEIMLSQDFQDLSGQVIRKVVALMERTERDLLALLLDTRPGDSPALALAALPEDLAGVQTPETAMAQGDVDDLLSQMGF